MAPRQHIVQELGFGLTRVGDELHGRADIVPQMFVPGTSSVRTSILATWTDITAGLLAVDVVAPRVPVTLELDVHLFQELPECTSVETVGRVLKAGRSVIVLSVDLTANDGEPLAMGTASFMPAPDPRLTMPTTTRVMDVPWDRQPALRVPFAERARCERREPGVAVLPRSEDGLNASNTVNGGLIALVVEEAVLSLTPGTTLSSLAMRYLQPARIGPVVASANVRAGLGRVEVRDAGNDDRLAVVATTRTFSAA